ncbi:MAG: heparan-alpha-glucosaminide N-acetyltransferase, partial [Bdellovibrionota bacterium]
MKRRYPLLDSLRGCALLLMLGYHFSFDLDWAGAAQIDFRQNFWLGYRALILALFLGIAGAGIFLSGKIHFARLARLAACAGIISLATWRLFPDAWVFFGILHFLVVASLIGPLFAQMPWLCLPLGAAAIALPAVFRSRTFDGGVLIVSGLSPQLPRTVDFVPLLPWFGIVLLGIFAGSQLSRVPASITGAGNAA